MVDYLRLAFSSSPGLRCLVSCAVESFDTEVTCRLPNITDTGPDLGDYAVVAVAFLMSAGRGRATRFLRLDPRGHALIQHIQW